MSAPTTEPAAVRTRRRILIFVISSLIDAVGTGAYMGGSAVYFVRTVHLSSGQVGLGATVAALTGLLATVPWGHAARRFGTKPVYLFVLVFRAACFVAYALVGGFASYFAVSCLLGLVSWAGSPLQQEMVALVIGKADRQRAMGWLRSTRNFGFTAGAGVAAVIATTSALGGFRTVVLVNAASFLVAAALTATLPVPAVASAGVSAPAKIAGLFSDRRYLQVIGINGVVCAHMTLLGVAIPLWLVQDTKLPTVAISMMVTINTIIVALFQVPVAKRIKNTRTAARALTLAAVMTAGCCAATAATHYASGALGMSLAALAALFLTGAEMLQSAAGWKLSFDLAPEDDRRPVYLARFNLGPVGQRFVYPVLFTAVVFPLGTVGWLAFGAVLVAVAMATPAVAGVRLAPPLPVADRAVSAVPGE